MSWRALLREGLTHAIAGRGAEADAVLGHLEAQLGEAEPPDLIPAAQLAFARERFHLAMTWLERAASASTARRTREAALEVLSTHAGRLGWEHEALEAGARLRALRPSATLELRELARRARQGDPDGARRLAERLLAAPQPVWERAVRIELCGALASRAAVERLSSELARLGPPERVEEALERVRLHVEVNECGRAAQLALDAHQRWPARAEPLVWCSRLALWSGDAAAAERQARAATSLEADSADAWCALGAALHVLGTNEAEADAAIDRGCQLDGAHCEAHTWLADRLARRGDGDAMAQVLNTAISSARQLPVMAWALRSLGALPEGLEADEFSPPRFQEVEGALEELVPGGLAALRANPSAAAASALLQRVRTALSGNYGEHATRREAQAARRLGPTGREGPRAASRTALELLRCLPVDEVLAAFDAVEARFPASSLPACHRAELLLWAGRLEEAEREFQRAISLVRGTRFAWIGLTGVYCLGGELDRALRVCAEGVEVMRDTSGPAVFVYRGEVLRRLGRLDEARADLERGVERSPRRLAATINLALTHLCAGDAPRALPLVADVFDRAPALVSDARRELTERGGSPADVAVLEQCLAMMRGNRSASLITYWSAGRLRLVPNQRGASRRIHEHDARELELAGRSLAGR